MTTLNPLAVQNAAVLRYLALPKEERDSSVAEAARKLERDESNLRKTFKSLQAAGLIDATRHLTDEGQDQLEAIDRAETGAGEAATAATPDDTGLIGLRHAQILPDPNNARRDWDSDDAVADLAALGADILANGLLQNLVVRLTGGDDLQGQTREFENDPVPGQSTTRRLYRLLAGERRWRAIDALIAAGDWPADRTIPCRLVEADTVQQRLTALAENFQRRNLNPAEKAEAFEELAALYAESGVPADKINRTIADGVKTTIEHVQQHRSFMKLDEAERARLALPKDDPKRLTVRDARSAVTRKAAEDAEREAFEAIPVLYRLATSELLHRVSVEAGYSWDMVPVASDFADNELGQALTKLDWIRFEGPRTYGDKIGHVVAGRSYALPNSLGMPFWSGTADDREAAIRRIQAEAGFSDRTDYVTAWLNGPFELTEEGRKIVEDDAAETAAYEAEKAKDEAAREQKEAEAAALAERTAAAVARARETYSSHRTSPPPAADIVGIAEDAGARLPWSISHQGDVIDADGEVIITTAPNGRSEARVRLMVLAINAAAGLETPEDQAPPEPEPDEAQQDINGEDPDADPSEFDEDEGED